jgi:hypothetical protein
MFINFNLLAVWAVWQTWVTHISKCFLAHFKLPAVRQASARQAALSYLVKDKATSKDASRQPHDLGFGSTIDQCFPKCTVLLDAKRTVLSLEAELGTIQTSHRCRLSLEEQETPFKKQMAAV